MRDCAGLRLFGGFLLRDKVVCRLSVSGGHATGLFLPPGAIGVLGILRGALAVGI